MNETVNRARGPTTIVVSSDEVIFDGGHFRRYHHNGKPTRYFGSADGNIYSEISNKLVKQRFSKDGYLTFCLYLQHEKTKLMRSHILVAQTFIPNPENKPQVNHKDGVKYHNWVDNLEWATQSENMKHAYATGLEVAKRGQYGNSAKFTDSDIYYACNLFMDGYNVLDVSKMTGISSTYLRQIIAGQYRSEISSLYSFPSTIFSHRPTLKVKPDEVYKIYELAIEGKSSKDIQKIMGFEHKCRVDDVLRTRFQEKYKDKLALHDYISRYNQYKANKNTISTKEERLLANQYTDDKFVHLSSDIEKIRKRFRQYISYSNEAAGLEVTKEILYNAIDECKNPRSPGNKIHVEFDERTGYIVIEDNGRGIPLDILEEVFTSLNMGSNIDTTDKAGLHMDNLGINGVGSLATCGLAERVVILSCRGGTENKYRELVFEEGEKVDEHSGKCSEDKHGMRIQYKPSKVMGANTRIVWNDVRNELLNFQYLNSQKITIDSIYIDKGGLAVKEKYKAVPFKDILSRNDKESVISPIYSLLINDDNLTEEYEGGITAKRYLSMDIAFQYTSSLTPYIDSFSNSNNTVDNGDHLDGVIEALCRYLQVSTRNALSDKEKDKLDIKWDDVRTGLSVAVSMRSDFENLYTGQTKHKIVSPEIRKTVVQLTLDALNTYFTKNQSQLKDLISIVKMNAKARREGDKVRQAVVKNQLTNWSSYKMKNFDPCTNKGKEYKEIFIVEGNSAKGGLKQARDPHYQALFAVRGVSLNVFKASPDQIVGQNGNREFTDLVTVLGCNIGSKFDINKLNYDKIIIATDADVDGKFIRSLLLAFFFRMMPEVIADGRLFIAEPPLYRVDDKKNPFVINKQDYNDRYMQQCTKDYRIGYKSNLKQVDIDYMSKNQLLDFLDETKNYAKDMVTYAEHFHVNDRLLEMVLEELAGNGYDRHKNISSQIRQLNIPKLLDKIQATFPEIYYDESDGCFHGVINFTRQLFEISEGLVRKCEDEIELLQKWQPPMNGALVLKSTKTGTESDLSLLEALKVIRKYQPNILHRFKGLTSNLGLKLLSNCRNCSIDQYYYCTE